MSCKKDDVGWLQKRSKNMRILCGTYAGAKREGSAECAKEQDVCRGSCFLGNLDIQQLYRWGSPAARRGLTGEWNSVTSRLGAVFGQVRHGISPRTTGEIRRRIGTDVVRLCANSMHISIRVESVAKREGNWTQSSRGKLGT